jgi:hypothetical protein
MIAEWVYRGTALHPGQARGCAVAGYIPTSVNQELRLRQAFPVCQFPPSDLTQSFMMAIPFLTRVCAGLRCGEERARPAA